MMRLLVAPNVPPVNVTDEAGGVGDSYCFFDRIEKNTYSTLFYTKGVYIIAERFHQR